MRHLDLFSGIGGFALACQWNGIETIGFVEIDKYCQKVLKKHFPDVPIVEDIRDVGRIKEIVANATNDGWPRKGGTWSRRYGFTHGDCSVAASAGVITGTEGNTPKIARNTRNKPAILITAGFPCQPFSVAGKQLSQGDDRYLWPQTLAVIEAIKPRWILLENVAGIINLALDTVLSDLEGASYATETLIIPACAVNAPHRRDRVWIVANTRCGEQGQCGNTNKMPDRGNSKTRPASETSRPSSIVPNTKSGQSRKQTEPKGGQDSGRGSQEDVADTQYTKTTRQRGHSREVHGITESEGFDINSSENWWAVEPEFRRVLDEFSKGLDKSGMKDTQYAIMVLALNKEVSNVTAKENRRGKILSTMSKENGTQKVQRSIGEQSGISSQEVLQQAVYGKISNERESPEISNAQESQQISQESLRKVQHDSAFGYTSYKQEPSRQFSREHNDAMQFMPCSLALGTWQNYTEAHQLLLQDLWYACTEIGYVPETLSEIPQIWESLTDKEKDWVIIRCCTGNPWHDEWPNIPRVATGVKNRVDRLKCLGNAIVPQVAHILIQTIMEVENGKMY